MCIVIRDVANGMQVVKYIKNAYLYISYIRQKRIASYLC